MRDRSIYVQVGDIYDRSNTFWYVIEDRTKGEHLEEFVDEEEEVEEIRHKNPIHGHFDDYYYDDDDRNNINETHILVVTQSKTDEIRQLRLPAPNPSLNLHQARLVVFNSGIYLLGGYIYEEIGPSRMVIYLDTTHPKKDWLKGPSLLAARDMLSAVALNNSIFFAFGDTDGGEGPFAEFLDRSKFLDPKNSWRPVPRIPKPDRSQIRNAQLLAVSGTKIFMYTTGEFCFGLTFDYQNRKWNIFDRSFCGIWHRGVVLDFFSNSYLFLFGLKSNQPHTEQSEEFSVYDLNKRTWLPLPFLGLVANGTVLPAPDTGLTDSFLFQMNQENKLAFVWSKPFYTSSEPLLCFTEIHCTKFIIRCTSDSDSQHPIFSAEIVSYGSYHVKGGASVYDCAVPSPDPMPKIPPRIENVVEAGSITSQTTSSSFSYSKSDERKFDVFLSFRGSGTCNSFTDHLYECLVEKGVSTFRDNKELKIGRTVRPELLTAIENSRMAIVVLTKDYASSTWCLDELAKIVDCTKGRRMRVWPIFYHVDPSDVRHQRKTFAEAFANHEECFKSDIKKVKRWRAALTEVANRSGEHLNDSRLEANFIQEIVEKIFSNGLVGIDSRVEEMNSYLDLVSNDVRFIGILGMVGIGKTTLAQIVFERIQHGFEASSFLSIKAHGLVALQEKLLCDIFKLKSSGIKWDVNKGVKVTGKRLRNKRVLIVLDDVDEDIQLETLAGNHDWFGLGSRIIVTTKDEHLLERHGVRDICTVKKLNNDEALQLFCWKAFNKPYPEENYVDLSINVVKYANGLPLTLVTMGKFLCGKEKRLWESMLNKLKPIPDSKIWDILQISFDSLRDTGKILFLDIACIFNGEDKDRVKDILDSCYYDDDLDLLIEKALITISGNKLCTHDLLQGMGRRIACGESPRVCSRLWHCKDAMKEKIGTDAFGSIFIDFDEKKEVHLDVEAFSKMKGLRLLKIDNVIVPRDLNSLSEKLLYMEWHDYPFKSLPMGWKPDKLVELIMHRSCIEHLKKEFWSSYKMALKAIDLSGSENFISTPDFTRVPNLERLILQGCTRLSKVDPSIAAHQKLVILNLKDCKSLNSLPHEINLESLETFILSGCSILTKFPEIGRNMTRLSELYLDGTAIEELPLSFKHLIALTLLNLQDCKNLSSFPSVICSWTFLKTLILSSSSSSKPDEWEFEVFLSFRGDTCKNFTHHLYTALKQNGISTFSDDEEIEIGLEIAPQLLTAIENSRMAVVVFSEDYASSTWCLEELAKIVDCMKERRMMVWPIFYHVDPSDVRYQRKTFADAFGNHEERFQNNTEKVERWRAALRQVADLSGEHLEDSRPESIVIQHIVEKMFYELDKTIRHSKSSFSNNWENKEIEKHFFPKKKKEKQNHNDELRPSSIGSSNEDSP